VTQHANVNLTGHGPANSCTCARSCGTAYSSIGLCRSSTCPLCPALYATKCTPDVAFVSALLFRQEGLRLQRVPLPGLSYPQCNVRTYVFDGEGVPSVLFWRELVPGWVVPGARLLGKQPASSATFEYPEPSRSPDEPGWRWQVKSGERLVVRASRGAGVIGDGPRFASWGAMVEHLRQRSRGYALSHTGLQQVVATHGEVAVWPLRAEVEDEALVRASIPGTPKLPPLHSAWLCPEIALAFELAGEPVMPLASQVPAAG
jgi:uncharacterized protein YqjF (DUF2071 family)